jgi:hypothetical protein
MTASAPGARFGLFARANTRGFALETAFLGLLAATMSTILLLLASFPAAANVPSTMSYQGMLTNSTGVPVPDGTYDLTFRLYPVSVGGAPDWTETQAAVSVGGGEIAVTLGSVSPLGLAFDKPHWLSIAVNGGAELAPRMALASAPYALGVRGPLSANVVDAQAIVDEPGIASSRIVGSQIVIGNGNSGIVELEKAMSVTITTPATGYILVMSTGMFGITNASGEQSTKYQLAETTGNSTGFFVGEPPYLYYSGFGAVPNGAYIDLTFACQRVFYKALPGTYTFSLGVARLGSYNASHYVYNPILNAIYLPASYGAVMVASSVAGPVATPSDIAAGRAAPRPPGDRDADLVDLRLHERGPSAAPSAVAP